jgi:hypothetical protein
MVNVSAAMGAQFAQIVTEITEQVRGLGPNPLGNEAMNNEAMNNETMNNEAMKQ